MTTWEGEKEPLVPQSVGDLIDTTFRQYRRDFPFIARVSLFILLPYFIISSIINYSTFSSARLSVSKLMNNFMQSPTAPLHTASPNPALTAAHFSMDIPLFLAAIIAYPLAYGTILHRVAERSLHKRTKSFGESVRFSASRVFQVIVTDIFAWLIVTIILLLAWGIAIAPIALLSVAKTPQGVTILVGIILVLAAVLFTLWVITRVSLTSSVVREEKRIFWPPMWQSWVLTRRSFWHTLGYFILVDLMTSVVQGGLSGVGFLLGPAIEVVVSGIATLLVSPFQMLAVANLYVDLRVRTDAPDLLSWMNETTSSETDDGEDRFH